MKSWKIGAISGLIAGIVASIVTVVYLMILYDFGLPFYCAPYHYPSPDIPFQGLAFIEIIFSIIWCVILGIIYSKIYDLIPGKGVLKGLVYGLGIYLIVGIRSVTFYMFYGDVFRAVSNFFIIFVWIAYGITLGIFYEFLYNRGYPKKKRLKIPKHNMTNGIHPGAIGGLSGGILLYVIGTVGFLAGLWPNVVEDPDIYFIIFQFGTHVFFNMIWGIIFGMLFVMFYKKIPKQGMSKGIVFGLTIYFITTFRASIEFIACGYDIGTSFLWITTSFIMMFTVGLVLGLLYRKPPK